MKKFFSFLAAAAMLCATSCSKSDDFEGNPETPQPANEIWYTSSDSSVVMPFNTKLFNIMDGHVNSADAKHKTACR